VHRHQRRALLGQQQHAGRVAVETVDELQERGGGTLGPQALDHPERDAAPAVDRHAGRLVDGQQGVVLEQDRQCGCGRRPAWAVRRSGEAHRRHPHHVAGGEPRVGAHPALVDPDFAAPDDPVNVTFRDAFQHAEEKIVDPLPGGVVADRQPAHSILA